ncbi:hypothetical protein V496_02171 [Pseudogymnoascus sp. VKM F-4515 (FW-2607)]|nr:hypothetical protein V496_02171 [Pseudogymnoascus sp. VKM F-4515 (FW-2607)]KFY93607.1 hypothetical protein V498_04332 [Pseudogymnoascus sp. VKM F-4517 (FW-2822)]
MLTGTGTVVRITPDEVHLSDPDNYEIINCVGTKFAKSSPFYDSFGIGYSTFSSGPNDIHRIRRGMLNPFFSRQTVLSLESIVHSKADKLINLLNTKLPKHQAVDLHHAFRAISVDVITDYAFGHCYNLLDTEDLGLDFFAMVQGIGPTMWIFQQWPSLRTFALSLPSALVKAMSKPLKQVLNLQAHCLKQVLTVKADMGAGRKSERQSIFEVLLSPQHEGYVVPTPDQIKDEAYSILAAAADTTGNAMTVAAYHVVKNPDMYKKLTAELKAAFPSPDVPLDYLVLEKLPYLTGVVKEGLRLAREVPKPGVTFNGYTVPAGYFVSMSSWIMHQREDYFPDSSKFDPERWFDPKEVRHMDKAFVPFSKGTRGCVGINLAYCELYVTLGTLFRKFKNLKGNELTAEDLVYLDYFSSYHPISATKFHVTA